MAKFILLSLIPGLLLTACTKQEEVGYYPTGEIKFRAHLNAVGVYDGECIFYYKTGVKRIILPFSKHQINGIVKRFYPSGKLSSEALYINSNQAGEVKGYYPTGELRSSGYVYDETPRGTMRYFYRNGEMQHLRIYDKKGKLVDFAEFTQAGDIDKRYTQVLTRIISDTVDINNPASLEVILANQVSDDIMVKINLGGKDFTIDSLPGHYSKYLYRLKFYETGRHCISGNVYQYEHKGKTTVTTIFPWSKCFVINGGRKLTAAHKSAQSSLPLSAPPAHWWWRSRGAARYQPRFR